MADPTQPKAWANQLTRLWGPRFPVEVKTIALEYTQQKFPDPITKIAAADVDRFEGGLFLRPKTGKWAILYNPRITSKGRINFTLAHELGHYFAHRTLHSASLECGQAQVLGYHGNAKRHLIEREADAFASFLLMPLNDYREQAGSAAMSLDLLKHCADRYEVSLTAAAIKWLDFTTKTATLVVATNGFVLWCWRSKSAKRRRIYYPKGAPLPKESLAARPSLRVASDPQGLQLDKSVWGGTTDVREMAIFADRYEMTISLLVFDENDSSFAGFEDEAVEDTYDRFISRL